MAYVVMAYVIKAYIVMAYIVMAYIVMAYIVIAYIVMADAGKRGAKTCARRAASIHQASGQRDAKGRVSLCATHASSHPQRKGSRVPRPGTSSRVPRPGSSPVRVGPGAM